ncbi:MAG TPA: M56 family metallopeptidase [bacterium]|nr:M56 family metallopeptidase [bacterium]HPN44435.1 M56 family metallopeptidase [bacterium]
MIPFINNIGALWFEYFGLAVLQNTLFLGFVFLAFYLLKNADARIKFSLGVVGLVKLLLPPFLPASFFPASNPTGAFIIGDLQSGQAVITTSAPMLSTTGILFSLWIITIFIYIAIAMISTLVMLKRLGSAHHLPAASFHNIKLYQSANIVVPMSLGLFPNKIYLPSYWHELPPEGQNVLLQHELAHIQRRDGLVYLLQTIVQALYFFHPFVWMLNERINEYREMACDDQAVRDAQLTPDNYSRYLVQVAEKIVEPQWSYASVSALVKQKNKLLNRVTYQLQEADMKQLAKHKITVVFITLFTLMLPLSWYSMAEKAADQDKKPVTAVDQQNTGKIFGVISDAKSGKFLVGAKITLAGTEIILASDSKGQFFISTVPPGVYTLEVACEGFIGKKVENVRVAVMQTSQVDIKLEPGTDNDKNAPPPPPLPFDVAPKPVKGFEELMKNVGYPESALKAGIEGKVLVNVLFDEKGNIVETKIEKGLNEDCNQAAINAIKAVKWDPAIKDGKPIKVWLHIPIIFKLQN